MNPGLCGLLSVGEVKLRLAAMPPDPVRRLRVPRERHEDRNHKDSSWPAEPDTVHYFFHLKTQSGGADVTV